jgi:hypothetical protein
MNYDQQLFADADHVMRDKELGNQSNTVYEEYEIKIERSNIIAVTVVVKGYEPYSEDLTEISEFNLNLDPHTPIMSRLRDYADNIYTECSDLEDFYASKRLFKVVLIQDIIGAIEEDLEL